MSAGDSLHSSTCKRWLQLSVVEHQLLSADQAEPSSRADVIRSQLSQIEFACASGLLSSEGACHTMLKKFADYSSVMDNSEDKAGVNNYAESILSLIGTNAAIDNQLWSTALRIENIPTMPCIERLEKLSKNVRQMEVPDRTITAKVAMSGGTIRQNNSSVGVFNSARQTSSSRLSVSNMASVGSKRAPCVQPLVHQLKSGSDIQSTSHRSQSALSRSNVPSCSSSLAGVSFGDDKERATMFAGSRCNDSSNRNFTGRQKPKTAEDQLCSKNVPADETNSAFVTARHQLDVNEQKKYGRSMSDTTRQGPTSPYSYGSGKRSLGARRGPSGKFVPPVVGRNNSDYDSEPVTRPGSSSSRPSGAASAAEEDVDPRLKNFEPRMLELIMSEIMDHGPPITWEDIAGLEFVKKTIKEIVIWPMLRPDIFTGLRGPPKGLLLFGPPGTGKTLIGKCIASQSKSTFFSISASSLTSKWVGEGEKMVRALFAVARVHQPAVVFIDEIDSLLSQRSDGEHESSRRIKTEFLVQLDGASTGEDDRILVVGATNRPQEIDEAARRRFVKRLYIPLPEREARKQIMQHLMLQQSNLLNKNDYDDLCVKTSGYSGADMANLCREAALGPIRSLSFADIENITADEVRPISVDDFYSALKQVRASVSDKDLSVYIEWNKQYGSWDI